jgi:hypothetical protein
MQANLVVTSRELRGHSEPVRQFVPAMINRGDLPIFRNVASLRFVASGEPASRKQAWARNGALWVPTCRLVFPASRHSADGETAGQRWTDAGLVVEGSGTRPYIAPENALPTTYWNPRMLLGPM